MSVNGRMNEAKSRDRLGRVRNTFSGDGQDKNLTGPDDMSRWTFQPEEAVCTGKRGESSRGIWGAGSARCGW